MVGKKQERNRNGLLFEHILSIQRLQIVSAKKVKKYPELMW